MESEGVLDFTHNLELEAYFTAASLTSRAARMPENKAPCIHRIHGDV